MKSTRININQQIIQDIITALLLLLFAYTGLSKLLTPGVMTLDLSKPEQPKLLYSLRYVLPYLIPISELVVVGLLLVTKYRKIGYYGALILMSIFVLYVGYILFFLHGLQRPCTCGGIFRHLTWRNHFFINAIYTGLVLIGLTIERNKPGKTENLDNKSIRYGISQ